MKTINYVEYKHSYAHVLETKLKSLNYNANVLKRPVQYLKGIVKNALNSKEVYWTEKEQYFHDNVMRQTDSRSIYYYCKNAVNKAKEISVDVDDNGNLIRFNNI